VSRKFRFRVRAGSAFWFGGDATTYQAGDEVVVDEPLAAEILRRSRTSVELVEIIDERPRPPRKLPG
jgi:hypothetical protein